MIGHHGTSQIPSHTRTGRRGVDLGLYTMIPSKFFGSGTALALGKSAALLFVALCEHANRVGQNTFHASDRALASDTGLSERTICDARTKLVEHGLVKIQRGMGQIHTYTIPKLAFVWVPIAERPRKRRQPRAYAARRAAVTTDSQHPAG